MSCHRSISTDNKNQPLCVASKWIVFNARFQPNAIIFQKSIQIDFCFRYGYFIGGGKKKKQQEIENSSTFNIRRVIRIIVCCTHFKYSAVPLALQWTTNWLITSFAIDEYEALVHIICHLILFRTATRWTKEEKSIPFEKGREANAFSTPSQFIFSLTICVERANENFEQQKKRTDRNLRCCIFEFACAWINNFFFVSIAFYSSNRRETHIEVSVNSLQIHLSLVNVCCAHSQAIAWLLAKMSNVREIQK